MHIEFKTKKLERWYLDSNEAQRQLGSVIARKHIQRVKLIGSVNSVEDLRTLPGLDYHSQKGDRAGQHAIRLDGFYRLIVTECPGGLRIEEVNKHYGD